MDRGLAAMRLKRYEARKLSDTAEYSASGLAWPLGLLADLNLNHNRNINNLILTNRNRCVKNDPCYRQHSSA